MDANLSVYIQMNMRAAYPSVEVNSKVHYNVDNLGRSGPRLQRGEVSWEAGKE